MHGLINRSIQHFLTETYGPAFWAALAEDSGLSQDGFETMLTYDDALTFAMIDSAASRLRKPRAALCEDCGSYLVSLEPLRRLLRFGGIDYAEFLVSLDELPDRAALAVPDLGLPEVLCEPLAPGVFRITYGQTWDGFGDILTGVLRAIADDYGSLVLIDHDAGARKIAIDLLDSAHAAGRDFRLAEGVRA